MYIPKIISALTSRSQRGQIFSVQVKHPLFPPTHYRSSDCIIIIITIKMAFVSAVPVLSARSARANVRCSKSTVRVTSFRGARVVAPVVPAKETTTMGFEISEGKEWDSNPIVFVLALVGWIVPSSIPSDIPLLGGVGLSQAFFASISSNLAAFPKGPGGDDPFWTLCFIWHAGMFATMIFGT